MKKSITHTATPLCRRDPAGNLDPQYAADLMAHSQGSPEQRADVAFLRGAHSRDALAERLGEAFVESATSGENDQEDALDEVVAEETGGPFVESTSEVELARGTDASNPRKATREPFPRT